MPEADKSAFHPGEIKVQELTGTREYVLKSGLAAHLRTEVTPNNQHFFKSQALMYIASMDAQGHIWASCVAGKPGFWSCSAHKATVSPMYLQPSDPLISNIAVGAHIGGLAIELDTRKRVRLNARITSAVLPTISDSQQRRIITPGVLELDVDQCFGSCPKFIQGRSVAVDANRLSYEPVATVYQGGTLLGEAQLDLIRASDTFFLATRFEGVSDPDASAPNAVGNDISHRGGPRGFVEVHKGDEGTVLKWAEYSGNNMFQSLGNLMLNPRAGLIFIDFETGDTLQLTGDAYIDYQDTSLGAMRVATFTVKQWVHVPGALPLRQEGGIEWSVFNPEPPISISITTSDQSCDMLQPSSPSCQPLVKVMHVIDEAKGIKTFYLQVEPTTALVPYMAGQYATFDVDDGDGVVQRTWTVTSHWSWSSRTRMFLITVKRSGRISAWLHDHVRPGVRMGFRGFGGDFTSACALKVDPALAAVPQGCLLLAGGIGITPLRVIVQDLIMSAGTGTPNAPQEVVLAYWVRQVEEAAFTLALGELAEKAAEVGKVSLRLLLCTTRAAEPDTTDQASGDGSDDIHAPAAAAPLHHAWDQHQSRLSSDFLSRHCRAVGSVAMRSWHVYVCGPPRFMVNAEQALHQVGVDLAHQVHTENFSF